MDILSDHVLLWLLLQCLHSLTVANANSISDILDKYARIYQPLRRPFLYTIVHHVSLVRWSICWVHQGQLKPQSSSVIPSYNSKNHGTKTAQQQFEISLRNLPLRRRSGNLPVQPLPLEWLDSAEGHLSQPSALRYSLNRTRRA